MCQIMRLHAYTYINIFLFLHSHIQKGIDEKQLEQEAKLGLRK